MDSLINMRKIKLTVSWLLKVIIATLSWVIFFIWPGIGLASNVVINEIMSDPSGTDTGLEWIELYNPNNQVIDLTGWQIGAGKYFTLPSVSMPAVSFLLIHWRADGQNKANEIFTGTQTIDANIGNSSGFVALFNSDKRGKDTIVDYVEFGKSGQTWESDATEAGLWQKGQFLPATEKEQGQSLGLKQDGQDQNVASDWQIFNQPTPNQSNSSLPSQPPPQTPKQQTPPVETQGETSPQVQSATSTEPAYQKYSDKVLINEFLPWPESGKEWVELINLDTETIDLSDWQIDDESEKSLAQKIPAGTLIEPNQLLVIELNKNTLNNEGDQVRLLWPDDQLVHSVSYQKALTGQSCARFEDGLWLWTNQPTPGQENKKGFSQTIASSQNQMTQQKITPLIEVTNESIVEPTPNQEQVEVISSQENEEITADQPSSSASQPAAIGSLAQKQTSNQKSTTKLILIIGSIFFLSLLTGITLVFWRKKKSVGPTEKPKVDSQQNPMLPF